MREDVFKASPVRRLVGVAKPCVLCAVKLMLLKYKVLM